MAGFGIIADASSVSVTCHTVSGEEVKSDPKLMSRLLALWGQLHNSEIVYDRKFGLTMTADCSDKKDWEERIAECKTIALIKDNDTVVGMALTAESCEYVDSYWIYVVVIDSAYRHKGFGKRLLQFIIENRPGKNAMLNVSAANPAGLALYKSLGFSPVSYRMKRNKA